MELFKLREALEKDAIIVNEVYTEFPEKLRRDGLVNFLVQKNFFVVPKQEGAYGVDALNNFLHSLLREVEPNSIRQFSKRKEWVYRGHKNICSSVLVDGNLPILLDLFRIAKFRGRPIRKPAMAVIYPLPDKAFYDERIKKDNTDYLLFKRFSAQTLREYQLRAELEGI